MAHLANYNFLPVFLDWAADGGNMGGGLLMARGKAGLMLSGFLHFAFRILRFAFLRVSSFAFCRLLLFCPALHLAPPKDTTSRKISGNHTARFGSIRRAGVLSLPAKRPAEGAMGGAAFALLRFLRAAQISQAERTEGGKGRAFCKHKRAKGARVFLPPGFVMTDSLQNTPLLEWHRKRGGRLVAFAGWRLPVFYGGVINEHLHTRASASLFDVSHMAQIGVRGDALARLSTADPSALAVGECKYAALLLDSGGIVDDFIVGNDGDGDYFCVFNAARKTQVAERLRAASAVLDDHNANGERALLAVQGPKAAAAVARVFPPAAKLAFMRAAKMQWRGEECRICRCGYTGEDGFEISAPAATAEQLADELLADGAVLPAGLGARDSLRLEAGLCLYGSELNEQTTPAEAGLLWIVGKERLQNGDFAGADVLRGQRQNGTARKLVGLLPQSNIPVRAGAKLVIGDNVIGEVSSGLFSPTLGAPAAMGFVQSAHAKKGGESKAEGEAKTEAVEAIVRGKRVPCRIAELPFVPRRYAKQTGRTKP